MPRIYITEPNHFYTFELPTAPGAEVLIGTAQHCQLALPGVDGLSEVHACISCQPQGYVIADLGSATGTYANGVPIRSEFLMPGVEYRLGAAVITLEAAMPQQQPMGMPPVQQAPMGMPQQQAPAPMAQAPQAATPQAQPATAKKKASPLKTGAAAGGATKIKASKGGKNNLTSMAAKFDRTRGKSASQATFLYVVVLLVVAFYAGIALHHWERTGNCLPGIVADEQDPPVVKPAATPAPAAEAETPQADTEADSTPAPADDTATDTPAADDDTTVDTTVTDDTPAADDDAPTADDGADDETSDEAPPAETDSPEPDEEPAAEEE